MRVLLVLIALQASAFAEVGSANQGPAFTQGPDRAFNCTHYLDAEAFDVPAPQVGPGEAMALTLPVDKLVKFKLAAKPSTPKAKVTFSLDHAPPGAKLIGPSFTWTVAGTPGQRFDFELVATEGDRATRWPIRVTIASQALFTAWSAGMGSVWPDCSVAPPVSYEIVDLDGDGRDDVVITTRNGERELERRVLLQRGAKLKFLEAVKCGACSNLKPRVTVDGTRLLTIDAMCCAITRIGIWRFDGDVVKELKTLELPFQPNSDLSEPELFEEDAQHRVTGIMFRFDDKPHKLAWDTTAKEFRPTE